MYSNNANIYQVGRFVVIAGSAVIALYGVKKLGSLYRTKNLLNMVASIPLGTLEDRAVGILLATAIGDAKGIPYENLTYEQVQEKLKSSKSNAIYLGTDNTHAFLRNYAAGKWTDDTQLSLAMAIALTKAKLFDMPAIEKEHVVALKFRTDGWGFGTKKSIENIAKGTHTFLNSGNKDSVGNGVIMKLCPLAFFYSIHKYDKDKMISEVALLSSMTHDTPISIICSCLFTLFAEKIFREYHNTNTSLLSTHKGRKDLADQCLVWAKELETMFLTTEMLEKTDQFSARLYAKISPRIQNLIDNFDKLEDTKVLISCSNGGTFYVADSLMMVLGIVLGRTPGFDSILLAATIGGDTDSCAAMVGGILGGVLGASKLIPFEYIEQLEDPAHIIDVGMSFAKSLQ